MNTTWIRVSLLCHCLLLAGTAHGRSAPSTIDQELENIFLSKTEAFELLVGKNKKTGEAFGSATQSGKRLLSCRATEGHQSLKNREKSLKQMHEKLKAAGASLAKWKNSTRLAMAKALKPAGGAVDIDKGAKCATDRMNFELSSAIQTAYRNLDPQVISPLREFNYYNFNVKNEREFVYNSYMKKTQTIIKASVSPFALKEPKNEADRQCHIEFMRQRDAVIASYQATLVPLKEIQDELLKLAKGVPPFSLEFLATCK